MTTVNNAAPGLGGHPYTISLLLHKYSAVELCDRTATLFEEAACFSAVAALMHTFPPVFESFSRVVTPFCYLYDQHSDRCEVVACGFDAHL